MPTTISPLWVLPFVLILLSIALLPLFFPHFWEKNRNKAFISMGLALPVGVWLVFKNPHVLVHTLHEYVSFIVLLAALFTISGGIRLEGDIKATPSVNTLFLALGAILANFIGTTGASMLLIRPLLETNKERKNIKHLPVFFIFIVSNIGGLLTPLGDPPLFLGYLKGVPFFWTFHLVPEWAFSLAVIILVFYFVDRKFYKKETFVDLKKDETQIKPLSLKGRRNFLLLGGVIASVFLPTPYREGSMLVMTLLSLALTPKIVRLSNRFTFHPIIEVAVLFVGIFIAMIPALELLGTHGAKLGIDQPYQFYWLTGLLSSFLDNAPTYLSFFSLAQSLPPTEPVIAGVSEIYLKAISCGAVMMGANSYIGNGPNFMVKAIADEMGVPTPSFFGYMGYAAVILVPIFIIITLVFFV